jgi:hypothetical protein
MQDRTMLRLHLGSRSRLARGLLGFTVVCLSGCGLRSDPDYSPVCVEKKVAGETDGGEAEPRYGSCEDPIDLPSGQTIVVRGSLGGCSGTEGWCGGSGAEDVYRIGTVPGDVFIEFLPKETNFNPVLRVVRGDDACAFGGVAESEVCADIKNSIPGRGFFDQGAPGETYYIIVDTELGESGEYAFEVRFGPDAFAGDCVDAVDEQAIELAAGGNFAWEASLSDEQGRIDSFCGAAGSESIFPLLLNGPGTLSASVIAIEGDIEPIVSVRLGCATTSELACGDTAVFPFGGTTSAYLVVDQASVAKGRYRLTVDYY